MPVTDPGVVGVWIMFSFVRASRRRGAPAVLALLMAGSGLLAAGCAVAPVDPLKLPANPTSQAGVRSVTVSWKAPTGPVARYLVHMVGAGNTACTKSPCTISGLAAGHPYAFSVAAVGLNGKTGPFTGNSNTVRPTAPADPLLLPARPVAVAGVRSVTVSWKAPTGPVARYLVHMVGAGNTTCGKSPCTISGLAAGHPYAFSVAAVGTDGRTGPYSANSNTAVPSAPTPVGPADPTPTNSRPTLPASASGMWQTNDAVWALALRNGVLYAAGDFASIRPPGAAQGTSETSMAGIAAFHADGPSAGTPCTTASPCPGIGSWTNRAIAGRVWALNISPDGKTLYAGGDFRYINGVARDKAAAFNIAAAGAPLVNWNPNIAGGSVRAIASTASTVYFGGAFTTAGGQSRPQNAAFSTSNYALTGFHANVDASIYALLIGPTDQLVLGGHFRNVNGAAHSGIAQVDLATGTVNGPMSNSIIPAGNASTPTTGYSDVKSLITDGTYIYVGAEGTGRGIFDGQASVNPTTGNVVWKSNCLGATQALALIGNVLYIGSHSHDCSSLPLGGFPQKPYDNGPNSWHHLNAEQARPTGVNTGGQLLTWLPKTNYGPTRTNPLNELGPRALATDGTTLFVGGQQTTVNGSGQQGLTRFVAGGKGTAPTAPAATATRVGSDVTVRWTGSSDQDDAKLSYRVYRNGVAIYGLDSQAAPWWVNKSYVYRDRNAPVGATYTVKVFDAFGLTAQTTISAPASAGYAATVLAAEPSLFWRLDESNGVTVKDASGNNRTGTYRGTNTLNKSGAIDKDAAIGQNGSISTTVAQNAAPAAPPKNFSLELWFRTTSTTGGRLIGWSNAATGSSAHPDRTLYLNQDGQLDYTTFGSSACVNGNVFFIANTCYLWSQQEYNDGGWHHVVVTQSSSAGASLYVDGVLVSSLPQATAPATYAGLWRLGGDSMTSMPLKGSTSGWNGDLDDVAVYPTVLSAAQVTAHYKAGN